MKRNKYDESNSMAVTKKTKKKVSKKKAATKDKGGRPSKFKPWMVQATKVMAEKGFIDTEIADALGISKSALKLYKKAYPEFMDSLKKGKAVADQKVVRALYQRAVGYSHPDVHISNHKGDVKITPIIKHYAPDVVACIYWTKNRMPDDWSDRKQLDLGGQKDNPLPPLTIILKNDDKKDAKPTE